MTVSRSAYADALARLSRRRGGAELPRDVQKFTK
jgi:hypothetical protein